MKRCPQCNRVEADEVLKFCRVDGATLVSESSGLGGEAGTAQLGLDVSEVHTSILPQTITNAGIAQTTVLPTPRVNTHELKKPSRRKLVLVTLVACTVTALAVSTYFHLSRDNKIAIDSIAVLPFQNASGDSNMDYVSDGVTESMMNSLSRLGPLKVMARSTMFRFKGRESDPQTVGKELGVKAVNDRKDTSTGK